MKVESSLEYQWAPFWIWEMDPIRKRQETVSHITQETWLPALALWMSAVGLVLEHSVSILSSIK